MLLVSETIIIGTPQVITMHIVIAYLLFLCFHVI